MDKETNELPVEALAGLGSLVAELIAMRAEGLAMIAAMPEDERKHFEVDEAACEITWKPTGETYRLALTKVEGEPSEGEVLGRWVRDPDEYEED